MINISLSRTVGLPGRLKQAANEAAGLAWTTEFPLLVFPGLFAEFARRWWMDNALFYRVRVEKSAMSPEDRAYVQQYGRPNPLC